MAIASDEKIIIHDCKTCLLEFTCNDNPYGNAESPCIDFIPQNWQDHIYSNGDWIVNK